MKSCRSLWGIVSMVCIGLALLAGPVAADPFNVHDAPDVQYTFDADPDPGDALALFNARVSAVERWHESDPSDFAPYETGNFTATFAVLVSSQAIEQERIWSWAVAGGDLSVPHGSGIGQRLKVPIGRY